MARTTAKMTLAALAVLTSLFAGCQNYQHGSLAHPQIQTVAIGDVENRTNAPNLTVLLQQQLREEILRDASLRLVERGKAQTVINARIMHFSLAGVAATKQRSESNRTDDRDAYQTTVYRAHINLEVMLEVPGREKPAAAWKGVEGNATFVELPDMAQARQDGLDQAVKNAAWQAITSITEAW